MVVFLNHWQSPWFNQKWSLFLKGNPRRFWRDSFSTGCHWVGARHPWPTKPHPPKAFLYLGTSFIAPTGCRRREISWGWTRVPNLKGWNLKITHSKDHWTLKTGYPSIGGSKILRAVEKEHHLNQTIILGFQTFIFQGASVCFKLVKVVFLGVTPVWQLYRCCQLFPN